uniref:Uncharacterized protein n=2 Tax=Physcomitrium patens TaxID=3218 RepID=A0A2K1JR41_PHYPA|nr:hypothetical protein PHYPA_016385 [Physcomitrium patens]
MSKNHLEVDGLVEKIIQTIKRGLQKYRLLYGNYGD